MIKRNKMKNKINRVFTRIEQPMPQRTSNNQRLKSTSSRTKRRQRKPKGQDRNKERIEGGLIMSLSPVIDLEGAAI